MSYTAQICVYIYIHMHIYTDLSGKRTNHTNRKADSLKVMLDRLHVSLSEWQEICDQILIYAQASLHLHYYQDTIIQFKTGIGHNSKNYMWESITSTKATLKLVMIMLKPGTITAIGF